jgi:hypothetical protein
VSASAEAAPNRAVCVFWAGRLRPLWRCRLSRRGVTAEGEAGEPFDIAGLSGLPRERPVDDEGGQAVDQRPGGKPACVQVSLAGWVVGGGPHQATTGQIA